MAQMDFLFDHHVVAGLYPKADLFDTSATTDWISMANYGRITFLVSTGNSTSDTSNGTITVLSSAVAAGTTTTWGALTDATASGFSMTAGDNYQYLIELTEDQVVGTIDGKGFVALKVTEVTNDPIVASVTAILSEPRYPQAIPVQAIA